MVDFDTQTLSECLLASGYDPHLISLFIWQGVTMYLTPSGVDATLAFVVNHAASGSAIVFDYLYQAVLDGAQKQNEITNMRRYRFMTGEGLTFGIPEGTVGAFLQQRGFKSARDVNAEALKAAYFIGKNASRKVVDGYGIVIGTV